MITKGSKALNRIFTTSINLMNMGLMVTHRIMNISTARIIGLLIAEMVRANRSDFLVHSKEGCMIYSQFHNPDCETACSVFGQREVQAYDGERGAIDRLPEA